MKLTGLRIEGLRKIKAAELDFDGKHLIEVRGRNGAGKTTVIDSILWMFKGARSIPADVVTHGLDKGTIIGTVGEYIIRRTIKADGSSTVTVETESGKVPKPQEFLDRISGQFLDPEWFASLPGTEKRAVVMRYAGIDFTDIDAKIAAAEQNRLIIGRELKALGTVPPEPEKAEEVSVSALLEELKGVNAHNIAQKALETAISDATESLRNKLKDAITGSLDELELITYNSIPAIFVEGRKGILALPEPDYLPTEEIESKITNSEAINIKARAYQSYLDRKKAIDVKKAEHDTADTSVTALRKEKIDMVAGAKLPMKGLEITETGLSFNGTTSENWSSSEALKIAVKLAVAWSGEVKAVYIRRGEAFDASSLDKIREYAEAMDFQVVVEIVDDSYAKQGDGVVQIEEGVILT